MFSLIGYTYAVILTEPSMLLGDVYGWLRRKIGHLPYLFKPLIDCDRCVSGQIALWYSLLNHLTVWHLIYLVMASVYFTHLFQKIHKWTQK